MLGAHVRSWWISAWCLYRQVHVVTVNWRGHRVLLLPCNDKIYTPKKTLHTLGKYKTATRLHRPHSRSLPGISVHFGVCLVLK